MTEYEVRIEKKKFKAKIDALTSDLISNLYDRGYSINDICKITGFGEKKVISYIVDRKNEN